MNEWEKNQKKDSEYYWNPPQKTDWLVKYEVASHYWNAIEKKSKWWEFKHKTKNIMRSIFIAPFVQFKDNIKMYIACKRRCNKADIEHLQHQLDMANARVEFLEMTRQHLVDNANKAWDTLAAYRKLEEDAAKEQAQNKKAAKKRPSSKKKR